MKNDCIHLLLTISCFTYNVYLLSYFNILLFIIKVLNLLGCAAPLSPSGSRPCSPRPRLRRESAQEIVEDGDVMPESGKY